MNLITEIVHSFGVCWSCNAPQLPGISRCEVDIRKTLMANVVLSGGRIFGGRFWLGIRLNVM